MYSAAAHFSPPIPVYFPRRDEGRSRRRHLFSRFSSEGSYCAHAHRSIAVSRAGSQRHRGSRGGEHRDIKSSSFPFPFYLKVLQFKIATAAAATPDDEGRGCCAYVQKEGGRKTGCFSARMRLTEETPEPRDQVCPCRRCCCTLRGERDGGRALKPPPRFDCLVAPTR